MKYEEQFYLTCSRLQGENMTRKGWQWCVLGVLTLVLLCGCAQIRENQNKNDFQKANYDYVLRLRWQDLHGAAKHMVPEHRSSLIKTFSAAKDLKITGLNLVTAEPDLKEGVAPAVYRMEYYLLPSVTLRSFEWNVDWEMVDGGWVITNPFPELPSGF